MSADPAIFWTPDTSVFFTSFWAWTPETWGGVGWTGEQGLTHRTNLLREISDPFIAVIYLTKSADDEDARGKIVGFYLMSHEEGHRNDFTHPIHHKLAPGKWVHSLRAVRAFTYLPECRIDGADLHPDLLNRAQAISKWGELLIDPEQTRRLREIPWVETDVYRGAGRPLGVGDLLQNAGVEGVDPTRGYTRAGPANSEGYMVSASAQNLPRQLYILRLEGRADDYLGEDANGCNIYKVGVSFSPEWRRQVLQKGMPRGAFEWIVILASGGNNTKTVVPFDAAVAGEYAMKRHLATCGKWLGGEFYLARESDVNKAWEIGLEAARSFKTT